jgi:hypothetical protein
LGNDEAKLLNEISSKIINGLKVANSVLVLLIGMILYTTKYFYLIFYLLDFLLLFGVVLEL